MASSETPVKFDLRVVHDKFSASLMQDDDVSMNEYIYAFKELYKFFSLLGTIFGFVGSDVKSKIEILEKLMKESSQPDSFSTFKAMVQHEQENGLLGKDDYVSGSRTLLRLHRGLDFIRLFLKKVGDLENKDNTSGVGQEAYNETLAQYHPWLIRKGVLVSLYALPTRENLLLKVSVSQDRENCDWDLILQSSSNVVENVCGSNKEEIQRTIDVLPKMLIVTEEVYNRTQAIYESNSLLDLP
ncbi:hypothetical protein J437_LFUL017838 [Ladona fulva]|uniref:Glycolipid transfer protein domain-containing protein n=1 Tax=Ladona fulva TaxID=123851 RepID=A0A8K0KNU3_LADFU|nr:hypothetical protein J437_LFUL017838 [Ladona fulva]